LIGARNAYSLDISPAFDLHLEGLPLVYATCGRISQHTQRALAALGSLWLDQGATPPNTPCGHQPRSNKFAP